MIKDGDRVVELWNKQRRWYLSYTSISYYIILFDHTLEVADLERCIWYDGDSMINQN